MATTFLSIKDQAPTVNDDSSVNCFNGALWVDQTNKKFYILVDETVGAAVWHRISDAVEAHIPLVNSATAILIT